MKLRTITNIKETKAAYLQMKTWELINLYYFAKLVLLISLQKKIKDE